MVRWGRSLGGLVIEYNHVLSMKRTLQLMALGIVSLLIVSCQSNEERAAKLIKKELYKTLYDFESYQPVETVVTEAQETVYNDSACWAMADDLAYCLNKVAEYLEEAEEAKESMLVYLPNAYSLPYMDNKYRTYKNEYERSLEKCQAQRDLCKDIVVALKLRIAQLDTSKVVGWEVTHIFRCKTRGGYPGIGRYRYVLDKDFERVILKEDMDDDDDDDTYERRGVLTSVLDGDFDDWDVSEK